MTLRDTLIKSPNHLHHHHTHRHAHAKVCLILIPMYSISYLTMGCPLQKRICYSRSVNRMRQTIEISRLWLLKPAHRKLTPFIFRERENSLIVSGCTQALSNTMELEHSTRGDEKESASLPGTGQGEKRLVTWSSPQKYILFCFVYVSFPPPII